MRDTAGGAFLTLVIVIAVVIGILFLLSKFDGDKVYEDFQKYDYITVEGQTFEVADIVEVKGTGGYDKYYTIILKDGTKIVAEGYILSNKK